LFSSEKSSNDVYSALVGSLLQAVLALVGGLLGGLIPAVLALVGDVLQVITSLNISALISVLGISI
jgi:uncharacterized membrane protein YesL